MKKTISFAVIFASIFLASCAPALPKAAAEMSVLLEKQIDALEKSHIKMINLYFEEKKLQAKAVVDNELYPAWLDDFFAKDVVKKGWNEAAEADSAKRMETFKGFVQIVQKEYGELLRAAAEPLEKLYAESLSVIKEEYHKARVMNTVIGENISSAQAVLEARSKLIPQNLKNAEDVLNQYLQKADNIINAMQNNQ
ncbi:MAG: hypothetical protein LBB56_05110 [Chitinispirillales bacterium]|jgi:ABC-type transporter MlaC component|nr:hypothetical protein [Chitinispirillales bacterium]